MILNCTPETVSIPIACQTVKTNNQFGGYLERVDPFCTLFVHSKRVSGNERVAWFGYSKLAARKAA
jgi:hypothetical protein